MTAREFIEAWDEAVSYMSRVERAAANVPDLAPEATEGLRRAMVVAIDVLDLARRSNAFAVRVATEHPKDDS